MKAKEKGIPITVVDSRYSESAAAYASGKGAVPPVIIIRPGTDGALMAAMAYVIYKNGLHDEGFLRANCFGFYPGDTITSRSSGTDPVTGKPFYGNCYQVPEEESFVEYLDGLELTFGGYQGVLGWAGSVTGVGEAVIEAFAAAYAQAAPSYIFSHYHGGSQRSYTGMYTSWMMIAMSAMTGNISKRGGGFGEVLSGDIQKTVFPPAPDLFEEQVHKPIRVSLYGLDRTILTGLDGRTGEQLRADVLAICIPACPVNKITKNPETGIVSSMDSIACMSCRRCEKACPWNSPQFWNEKRARMTKCDLCESRIREGRKPACVASCIMRALDAGPMASLACMYPEAELIEDRNNSGPNLYIKKRK